jgi:protein-tyrosine phosphatase
MSSQASGSSLSGSQRIAQAAEVGVPAHDLPSTVVVERRVNIEGSLNFRELGGIVVDGGAIRSGVLFRSDHLNDLTPNGLASLTDLGLRRVFDFRLPAEQERQPSKLPEGMEVTNLATGDLAIAEAMVAKIPAMLSGQEPIAPATFWDDNYVDMLNRSSSMFTDLVRGLAIDDGVPALFHCTGGKDRTGMAAMLILATLGASDNDIIDDFLATNVWRTPLRLPHWKPQFEASGITTAQAMPILGVTRSGISAAVSELRRQGGAPAYLEAHGVTKKELAQLRDNLVG